MNENVMSQLDAELEHAGEETALSPQMLLLEQLRITPEKELPKMDFLFRLFGKPCFPRRELVAITGKAKSGKTFVTSMLMACCQVSDVLSFHREPESPLRLLWYDTAREGTANFHLVFLMHLSRFLGFFPNLETYHRGWYFDMENSTFQPIPPAHSHFLHPADASYLPLLLRLTPSSMKTIALSGQERSRLLALIIEYYRLHVADFPELKSLDVLHEVFSQ